MDKKTYAMVGTRCIGKTMKKILLVHMTILLVLVIASKLFSETVQLEYVNEAGKSQFGSAVIYSADLCITAGHVVDFKDDQPVIVKRQRRAINGNVVYVMKGADLALIKLEKSIEAPTLLVRRKDLEDGETLLCESLLGKHNMTIVGYGEDNETKEQLYFFSFIFQPGMSGSPIYDKRNRIVSIVSGKTPTYGVGCHHKYLAELIENAD